MNSLKTYILWPQILRKRLIPHHECFALFHILKGTLFLKLKKVKKLEYFVVLQKHRKERKRQNTERSFKKKLNKSNRVGGIPPGLGETKYKQKAVSLRLGRFQQVFGIWIWEQGCPMATKNRIKYISLKTMKGYLSRLISSQSRAHFITYNDT